jgi:hypothetical protein
MTKFIFIVLSLLFWSKLILAAELVVIGDSQIGATWSKSYVGNYLQKCLKNNYANNFIILGRGATTLGSWLGSGNLDHIETIQRDLNNNHLNLGSRDQVPLHKKRLDHILNFYKPQKIVLNFGGNSISQSEQQIKNDIYKAIKILNINEIPGHQCYFVTPSFEMEVATRRNLPSRDLDAVTKITEIISRHLANRCQLVSGLDLMQKSNLLNPVNFTLKRIPIEGDIGCLGAAANDNVHICGLAAKELADKICELIIK